MRERALSFLVFASQHCHCLSLCLHGCLSALPLHFLVFALVPFSTALKQRTVLNSTKTGDTRTFSPAQCTAGPRSPGHCLSAVLPLHSFSKAVPYLAVLSRCLEHCMQPPAGFGCLLLPVLFACFFCVLLVVGC